MAGVHKTIIISTIWGTEQSITNLQTKRLNEVGECVRPKNKKQICNYFVDVNLFIVVEHHLQQIWNSGLEEWWKKKKHYCCQKTKREKWWKMEGTCGRDEEWSIATPMVVVTVSQYLLQVVSMSIAAHLGDNSLSSAAIATLSPMLLASVYW